MMSDIELLSIQFQTLFLITGSGRIERENDPDYSPGPRLYLAGCVSGNVAGLRSDVTDDLAAEIMSLIAKDRRSSPEMAVHNISIAVPTCCLGKALCASRAWA
jgi:hypothetical protein